MGGGTCPPCPPLDQHYVYLSECAHLSILILSYVQVCMHVCAYACLWVHMCMCALVYACTDKFAYLHLHTYYIQMLNLAKPQVSSHLHYLDK